MEKNQKINCTVKSCKYNNRKNKECGLSAITIAPVRENSLQGEDESVCSSYDCE